jgi:hypothetical protein
MESLKLLFSNSCKYIGAIIAKPNLEHSTIVMAYPSVSYLEKRFTMLSPYL